MSLGDLSLVSGCVYIIYTCCSSPEPVQELLLLPIKRTRCSSSLLLCLVYLAQFPLGQSTCGTCGASVWTGDSESAQSVRWQLPFRLAGPEIQNSLDLGDRGCLLLESKHVHLSNNSKARDSLWCKITTVQTTTSSLVFDDFRDDYFPAHGP